MRGQSTDKVREKISRRGGPKSRRGCYACKKRHIKCDETKPECHCCKKAGWTCDGYEPNLPSQSSNSSAEDIVLRPKLLLPRSNATIRGHSKQDPTLRLPPLTSLNSFDGTLEEQRLFNLFISETSHKMRGLGPSWSGSFWCLYAPQIASTEKAVKHGIIALARLHEDFASSNDFTQSKNNKFVLTQYNKALAILGKMKPDISTTQITLLTCYLFAVLEMMRGNPRVAYAHMRSGMRIFESYRRVYDEKHSPSHYHQGSLHNVISSSITNTLGYLMFAIVDARDYNPMDILVPEEENPPLSFTTTSEAQDSLDNLLARCLVPSSFSNNSSNSPPIKLKRTTLPHALRSWTTKLTTYHLSNLHLLTTSERRQIRLLRIQSILMLMWSSLIRAESQMAFDSHTSDFETILSIMREEMATQAEVEDSPTSGSPPPPSTSKPISMEVSPILSLIIVAFKCRSPSIRHEALNLLTQMELQVEDTRNANRSQTLVKAIVDFEENQCDWEITEDPRTWPREEMRVHATFGSPFQDSTDGKADIIFLWCPKGKRGGSVLESWVLRI